MTVLLCLDSYFRGAQDDAGLAESACQSHCISPSCRCSGLTLVFFLLMCLVTLVATTIQIMMLGYGSGRIEITCHVVDSSDSLRLSELAEPCGGAWESSIVHAHFKGVPSGI